MKSTRTLLSLFAAFAALIPGASHAETIAITDAIVFTNTSKARLDGATVVVKSGKIAAVGVGIKPPKGARVIDGKGMIVTPGLIDVSTTLGLVEVSQVSEANDGHFSSAGDDKVHAAYRVVDGYNDRSVAIPLALTGGVTAVVASPRGSLIAGQSAFFRLTPGASTVVRAPLAMVAQLGSQTLGGSPSRGMVIERLRELLDDAREYQRVKGRFARNQSRRFAAERLDLEALGPVIKGRLPLIVRAHRMSDLRAAITLKKELGLDIVIEGGTEAWLLADELAAAKIPVIVDPLANLPYNFDRIHVRPDLPARLHKAGVEIAISTLGSASNVRRLRQLAGNAMANGLPEAAAIAAITSAPARIFGIKKLGEISRGAPADLVVWTKGPFDLISGPRLVLVGGVEVSLRTRQTMLLERYRRLPTKTR